MLVDDEYGEYRSGSNRLIPGIWLSSTDAATLHEELNAVLDRMLPASGGVTYRVEYKCAKMRWRADT